MNYSILHVIPYFAPAWGYGGPVKIAWNLAKEAVRRGNKVSVFTTTTWAGKDKTFSSGEEYMDGIRVVRFDNRNSWLAKQNIWLPAGLPEALRKEIKQYDIVCLHEYRTFLNVTASQIASGNNIPCVLFAYGNLPHGSGWKKWAKIMFDLIWGRKMLQSASGVFVQTDNEARECLKFDVYKQNIFRFPLLIDISEFRKLPERFTARKKFHLGEKDFVITFLGRLHKYKGIDLLINAVEVLQAKIPRLKLLIVGRDDGYLATLKELLKTKKLSTHVIIHPPLYGQVRLLAYRAADVFVLTPNFYEETSLAALEALACGTAVIVTKQAEIPYLENYGCGAIIEYNLSQLISKLIYYNQNKKTLFQLEKKARMLIEQKYNLDILYDQFEKQLSKII